MRIEKITVKNLFGIFNHEIPLNTKEHITIMIGPNGFGKTVLLRMLNALFNLNYRELRRMPFNELLLDFDDKSILKLEKIFKIIDLKRGRKIRVTELKFEFKEHRKRKISFTVSYRKRRNDIGYYIPIEFERDFQEIDNKWIEPEIPPTRNLLYERYLHRRMKERQKEPEWLKKLINSINIRFIDTQRLIRHQKLDYEEKPSMVPAVIEYSKELVSAIQKKLAEYATLSQSLDRNFPMKLVQQSNFPELTIEKLKTELKELEEKRSRLMAVGLLDKEKEIDFRELLKNIDDSNINVLSVYIGDVKEKLSVFDELYNKIDLLVSIINTKFLYKQLLIDKEKGFVFKTSDGKILLPENLSSGEQQELVLFYELLFKVSPNSLILIDEPELSLHVLWQHEFLRDLENIIKLTDFDVLIATHSPQIIHDRGDLTVELKGPKDEKISNSS